MSTEPAPSVRASKTSEAAESKAGPKARSGEPKPAKREDRKVDAILIPSGFVGPPPFRDQQAKANSLFGPMAGVRRFWWIQVDNLRLGIPNHGYQHFAEDLADVSLFFGEGHPLSGQPRYEWFLVEEHEGQLRPTGLCPDGHEDCPELPKVGFRVADPARNDPAAIVTAQEFREKRKESYKNLLKAALHEPELYEKLKAKLGWSDDEMEASFAYVDRIPAI